MATSIRSLTARPAEHRVRLVNGAFIHNNPAMLAQRNGPNGQSLYRIEHPSLENFGIIAKAEPGEDETVARLKAWRRLQCRIQDYNLANRGSVLVLVYFSRHAEGWHNRVLTLTGDGWDESWSRLANTSEASAELKARTAACGNIVPENINLLNPSLTGCGFQQAAVTGQMMRDHGLPLPTTIWVSPMRRSLQTTRVILSQLPATARADGLEIHEHNRETFGQQPCDRRHSARWIEEHFGRADGAGWLPGTETLPEPAPAKPTAKPSAGPAVTDALADNHRDFHWPIRFEPGFETGPTDPYWTEERETDAELEQRTRALLDNVGAWALANSGPLFVGTHGHVIGMLQHVLGFAQEWMPNRGEMMPMLLEVTRR